jgi:hypothetical protein
MFAGHIGAGLAIGRAERRGRKVALTLLLLAILAFTVIGMTVAPPPPSISTMAASSLATIALVTAAASWIGRVRPAPRP